VATAQSSGEIEFGDILRAETEAINQRRARFGRPAVSADNPGVGKVNDTVGLALSGGGIRSAAFSLGILQALNHHGALRNIDYLSTVSGGGYMGCALTTTMTQTQGSFVFGNAPAKAAGQAASEIADTPAVGHLRNYSNYLIPAGARDLLTGGAIVLRGLVANLTWILLFVLLLAAATIVTNPYRSSLGCPDILGYELCTYVPIKSFGLSLVFSIVGLSLFFLWGLYRSLQAPNRLAEFRTILPALASSYLVFLGIVLFVDLQTFTLDGMFLLAAAVKQSDASTLGWLTAAVKTLAAIAAPIAAIVTFFRQQMGEILKAANAEANLSTRTAAALSRVAFWVAGAALPLALWVAYLYLSYWGIINDLAPVPPPRAESSEARPVFVDTRPPLCQVSTPNGDDEEQDNPQGEHTPEWMITLATWVTYSGFCPLFRPLAVWEGAPADAAWQPLNWFFERVLYRPMVFLYAGSGFLLLLVALLLKPNANSLHRLYRDRLSKAFLFDPRRRDAVKVRRNEASIDQGRDFEQLDDLAVSALSVQHAPYHLINAALNIQGSDYANRRGRNADFFVFSPRFVGSDATGYAPTPAFEHEAPDLNVATAMAISGAAASSNMGSNSSRPLRPTLALLNIRLGYWLKNPRYTSGAHAGEQHRRRLRNLSSLFLLKEIAGRLYENSNDVYLTDGGHIENLGVYELLKRRCKLIVVVDSEADFTLRFPSFITLQRYARIDLGIRIEMPWDDIRKTTCARMGIQSGTDEELAPAFGPHAAIGTIDYGEGCTGHILYFKTSLSGDENDYVRDYARRFVRFPHETTGDQFFSEEQFEVYRALGFHVAHGALSGRDDLCVCAAPAPKRCKFDADDATVKPVREALVG
jgi:hypothetical protein